MPKITLEEEVLQIRSRVQVERLARQIYADRQRIRALMELFLRGDVEIARRSSWVVRKLADKDIAAVEPYLARMIDRMNQPEMHPAVRREVTAILQCATIPARLRGRVLASCFDLLADASEPVAVRANAMTVVERIANIQPELAREARLVIEQNLPYASGAFLSRARHILPALRRLEESIAGQSPSQVQE